MDRLVDADGFKSRNQILTNNSAAIPLLEDGVKNDNQESGSRSLLEESPEIPKFSIAGLILQGLFDLLNYDVHKRMVHVVAFSRLISSYDIFSLLFLSPENEVTRGFWSPKVDRNADDERKEAF